MDIYFIDMYADDGGNAAGKQEGGCACSPFLLSSLVATPVLGWWAGSKAREAAEADEAFQRELAIQRETHADDREARALAHRALMRRRKREHTLAENARSQADAMLRPELDLFFRQWPLAVSPEAYAKRLADEKATLSMSVVVAPLPPDCPLAAGYGQHVADTVATALKGLGVKHTDQFHEKATIPPGPAVAYIYAMSSALPTVVLMPEVSGGRLTVAVACWVPESLFPLLRPALSLDGFDAQRLAASADYLRARRDEMTEALTAVAAVLSDCYALADHGALPCFPKYAKEHNVFAARPEIAAFARREYSAARAALPEGKGRGLIDKALGALPRA